MKTKLILIVTALLLSFSSVANAQILNAAEMSAYIIGLINGDVTRTGTQQLNGTFTMGVDDTGYDFKLFGATSGAYLLWDESDDGLELNAAQLDFTGTHTSDAIDFTNTTINFTGSSGPAYIRAGTYGTPVTNADEDQSGMFRMYWETSADGSSYDRGLFICLKTTGTKAIFPISGLAEVLAQSGVGPTKAMAGQFIVGLHTPTSKLAASTGTTDGMFASWFKVYSVSGSVAASTSRVAAIWLDNSMGGTVSGEHYSAFITSGGIKADAVFGLETGSGWSSLFYFDETAYDQDPVSTVTPATQSNDSDGSLIINLNGTLYYIPYFGIGAD